MECLRHWTRARFSKHESNNIHIHKFQSEEMNKVTLLIVFICGVIFSILISMCKSYFQYISMSSTISTSGLGVLPPDTNLELMDDGYIAMALLGAEYYSQGVSKKAVTELEEKSTELEALNTAKAAVELVADGKVGRAGRLFEHAHSLAPRHPDILVTYGEYIENERNDVIEADHLFLKALTISPQNSRALRHRKRTQPLVDRLDSLILSRIDDKRDSLRLIPGSSGALRRIKKEAYFQHIYHTAGIEGNTLTLAQTRMILETGMGVAGKSVLEQNEILGLDLALKYINTTLVHRVGRICLIDVLEIHRRVLGHADPIEAGRLRTTQVFVSDHVPPPPSGLQLLMEEFVAWLNSEDAQNLHPVKYAALAHYKFVFIHPFVDGNGRTARLLMNFLLMQAGYPPVIIRKQDRMMYYNHLQTANDGDTRPFVRFIAHCAEKTLDVYLWATKEHFPELEAPPPPSGTKTEAGTSSEDLRETGTSSEDRRETGTSSEDRRETRTSSEDRRETGTSSEDRKETVTGRKLHWDAGHRPHHYHHDTMASGRKGGPYNFPNEEFRSNEQYETSHSWLHEPDSESYVGSARFSRVASPSHKLYKQNYFEDADEIDSGKGL